MKLRTLLCDILIRDTNLDSLDIEVSGICSDSRDVERDSVFICIAGNHRDGHDYISEAILRGAAVMVIGDAGYTVPNSFPYVLVDDTRYALCMMWSARCGDPADQMKIVGVTGTNGKSSTVNILNTIFKDAGIKCACIGTMDGSLTTPDPQELYPRLRQLADAGTEYVFLEASSHALYYNKLAAISFEAGVFTNLTPEHLDFHGTMENYAHAKARLFHRCKYGIFNYDSIYLNHITEGFQGKAYYFSDHDNSVDFHISHPVLTLESTTYELVGSFGQTKVKCKIPGEFTVYNTLAAIATASVLGIDTVSAARAVSKYHGIAGRLEEIETGRNFRIFIDYAHTPDALERVLGTIKACMARKEGRLVTVFGCGGDRDKSKRAPMGHIASEYSDFSIITSDNCRSENPYRIITDIMDGFDITKPFVIIADRKQAIEYAVRSARDGDIILLCGKGHEDYEIDRSGKKPFSEKDIIRKAINLE